MPVANSKKSKFDDFLGSDGRVRPYFGIYGSQSARSQPGATGFIPLKAAWMRNFIEPKPGFVIASADFVSQEFLISAIVSQDKAMMDAYASGDVYLAFAKAAKLVPESATKESHKKERDIAKQLVLGISYDMSARGLAPRLSAHGESYTEDKAQELIDLFFETYSDFADWKLETIEDYKEDGCLKLPSGWVMWGDNPNFRSVGNFPIQGLGSDILREAVMYCQADSMKVIYTVHDSIAIEYPIARLGLEAGLEGTMQEAFDNVMRRYGKTIPVRIDGHVWSPDFKYMEPKQKLKNFDYMSEFCDKKGEKDLQRYRTFFT
jgi:DNA polymerase I-like protein with 3'-5' exonuclease and polymerase domains